jgi:hypothetical protein
VTETESGQRHELRVERELISDQDVDIWRPPVPANPKRRANPNH